MEADVRITAMKTITQEAVDQKKNQQHHAL